jgi:hypothetical protein
MLADKGCHCLGLKEVMELYNELMLADKGYHALAAWQGEVIDQAIEVSYPRSLMAGIFIVI